MNKSMILEIHPSPLSADVGLWYVLVREEALSAYVELIRLLEAPGWAEEGKRFNYAELKKMAADAEPFAHLIDPDDERFFNPADMPATIGGYCLESGQPEPASQGAVIRCILESLALLYRQRIQDLSELTGKTFTRLHVIGGGSQNELLNQFTADALGIPVIAGPSEATALGNVAAQALAMGKVSSLAEVRRKIASSSQLSIHQPRNTEEWIRQSKRLA